MIMFSSDISFSIQSNRYNEDIEETRLGMFVDHFHYWVIPSPV